MNVRHVGYRSNQGTESSVEHLRLAGSRGYRAEERRGAPHRFLRVMALWCLDIAVQRRHSIAASSADRRETPRSTQMERRPGLRLCAAQRTRGWPFAMEPDRRSTCWP